MISLVIVNYRTPDDLCRLLVSLREKAPRQPLETIVVDNASLDDSVARVRRDFPEVRVIESPRNSGFAAGVNLGLAAAHGDPILILNPDIETGPGSIDTLAGFLAAHPRAGLVAARLENPDGTLQYTCRRFYTVKTILLRRTFLGRLFPNSPALRDHLMLDYDHQTPREVDWVAGACLMVRRRAVEDVGPMDERYFMYFEDVDWCLRMARRGWGVWYVPEARMVHGYRRASAGGFGRAARAHAGSLLLFWEKWSAILYLLRRHRARIRSVFLLLADFAALNLAFYLAYVLRTRLAPLMHKPLFPLHIYASFLITTDAVALATFALTGLYREDHGDWVDTLFSAGRALLVTCLILLASTFLLYAPGATWRSGGGQAYSRFILLTFWVMALVLVTLERRLIDGVLATARERRINVRRLALLGAGPALDDLLRRLRADPRRGFEPVRVPLPKGTAPEALVETLRNERVSDAVLVPGATDHPAGVEEALRQGGITPHYVLFQEGMGPSEARVVRVAGTTLVSLPPAGGGGGEGPARAFFDWTVAAGLVIVYLLPAFLSWILLVLTGRHPRVTDGAGGVREWTANGWGRSWLRRLSLDRFPGLLAVLAGRQRLVGVVYPAVDAAGARSAERDLKSILRSTVARLAPDPEGPGAEGAPLLKGSQRSALR